jgi:hypothetical protein
LLPTPNYQNTAINAAMGLHDDGKTGGTLNSWEQYAKSGDIIFDVAGGGYPNLIITIIAVRVFLVDNCYNCI